MKPKHGIAVIIVFMLFAFPEIYTQQTDSAFFYLGTIAKEYGKITESFISYSGAVAHGKSARKAENKRIDYIKSIGVARIRIESMPPFRGSTALRDSVVSFLSIAFHVMNEDFGKIINLEEVAEQSYDLMEAYFLAQDMASEKMQEAGNRLDMIEKEFILQNNILVSEQETDISKKVKAINSVQHHHRQVYLIMFKSYKQEIYLLDVLNKKDMNAAEQNRNALLQTAIEGLSKLDTLSVYKNDRTLVTACRRLLEFYKTEARDKMTVVIDYYLKAENFEKINAVFQSKDPMARTPSEVDQYNKAVNEFNAATRSVNVIHNSINQSMLNSMNSWKMAEDTYLQRHIPQSR